MADPHPAPPSRGEPAAPPETAASRPDPTPRSGSGLRPIARAIDRALPLPARRQAALIARLKLDWAAIVGAAIAGVAVPERLGRTRGDALPVLHLRVESAAALELQHREPELLARIARHFGHPVAQAIRLRQGRIAPARHRAPPLPGPLSPSEAGRIESAVRGIADPALAEALAELGRAVAAANAPDRVR